MKMHWHCWQTHGGGDTLDAQLAADRGWTKAHAFAADDFADTGFWEDMLATMPTRYLCGVRRRRAEDAIGHEWDGPRARCKRCQSKV